MITSESPTDWRDLQSKVASLLKGCMFDVEIEKKIEGARGTIDIDVYAEEIIGGRRYAIACECKYWTAKIPQSVIHGFRTVISDVGANLGYIITTSGFQSGSITASNFSNIKLLTWPGFQKEFEETWYPHYLARAHSLLAILEVDFGQFSHLQDDDKKQMNEIVKKAHKFRSAMQYLIDSYYKNLPLVTCLTPADLKQAREVVPEQFLHITAPKQMLEAIDAYNHESYARACEIYARNRHRKIQHP